VRGARTRRAKSPSLVALAGDRAIAPTHMVNKSLFCVFSLRGLSCILLRIHSPLTIGEAVGGGVEGAQIWTRPSLFTERLRL
jgi:hypothetical protein